MTVVAGDKPVTVARCESVNGRPAAQIRWETVVNGNATTLATQESDNTVTIRSEYKLRPTPADNGKDISCVVVHRTQAKPESFTMKLTIECKCVSVSVCARVSVCVCERVRVCVCVRE